MLTPDLYTPLVIIRMLLNAAKLGACVYFSATIIARGKLKLSNYLYAAVSHIIVISINYLVLGRESPFTMIASVACTFFIVWLSYRRISWSYLRDGFVTMGLYILSDMVCGMILIRFYEPDQITEMRYFFSRLCYIPDIIVGVIFLLFALTYSYLRSLLKGRQVNFYLLRVVRPLVLLITIVLLYARNMQRIAAMDEITRGRELTMEYSIIVIILLLGASYIVQDVRYAQQKMRNLTLEQQQETQNILLQETRMFRHNIANMLYGLQGMILTRNYDSIWNYYQKIAEKCAVINNENIIALRRIPSMAMNALLVQKIQSANDENIPFYVFTDENLSWRGAKDGTVCQIMGVLIDNAIEATRGTDVCYVSLEAHNVPHGVELVVRNTWKQQQTDFLYSEKYKSKKPGHEGLGLSSVRKLVKKDRHMIFNIYPSGRYVEANLQIFW